MIDLGTVSRALTIRQPWAWLIVQGIRKLEIRSWWPSVPPGAIAIHAAQAVDFGSYENIRQRLAPHELQRLEAALKLADGPAALWRGGVVGVASFYDRFASRDAIPEDQRRWFPAEAEEEGLVPWAAGEAASTNFVPCPGKLGLWSLPREIHGAMRLCHG